MTDLIALRRRVDLLAVIGRSLKRVASTEGGEYAGACPFCGGDDRFRVQPYASDGGRWFCRQCTGEPDNGGRWQSVFDYIMRRDHCKFGAALAQVRAMEVENRRLPNRPRKSRAFRPPTQITRFAIPDRAHVAQPVNRQITGDGAHLAPVPICQQPAEVEEAWWARVFAERGIPDPAHVANNEATAKA